MNRSVCSNNYTCDVGALMNKGMKGLIYHDTVDNGIGAKDLGELFTEERVPDICGICTASSAEHMQITSTR